VSYNDYLDEEKWKKHPGRMGCGTIAWIIIGILVLGILGFVGKVVFFPAKVANNVADTAYGVVDKVINADNALFNYQYFYDQYNAYGRYKNIINNTLREVRDFKTNMPADRTKWTDGDKTEWARLNSNLNGQRQMLEGIIADYNSKSDRLDSKLFKAKELPYKLDSNIPELVDGV
jgi:hypothetical protein